MAEAVRVEYEEEPHDVVLTVLPLFHAFGMSCALNTTVRHGGTIALVPHFDAAAVLDSLGAGSASSTWTDGRQTLVLALGPLVPGQQGCRS